MSTSQGVRSKQFAMTEEARPRAVKRGTHAARSAAMRRRLIDCTIESLHELGYAATTTLEVQRRAGVSRGALLHHFATKVDLILETARDIVERQTAFYYDEVSKVEGDRNRLVEITAISWEALKRPSGMALLEILMGTRSDPELARRFPPVAREIERIQQGGMWVLAKNAGIRDHAAVRRFTNMSLAALRGLSIQLLFAESPEPVEQAIEELLIAWREWMARMCPVVRDPDTTTPLIPGRAPSTAHVPVRTASRPGSA